MNLTQEEISKLTKIDQSNVSRRIKFLKEESKRFIEDLAKETFGFLYRQSLEGLDMLVREGWLLFKKKEDARVLSILADIYVKKLKILEEGPIVHQVQRLGEKSEQIRKSA